MDTLKRHGWTTRTAFMVMLLMVFASLMVLFVPTHAFASPCCGWRVTTNYYSDETHATLVGRCIDSDCTGSSCTGEQTPYYTTTIACCERCIA
jgi:hypothetical protein